jgi:Cu/Ag efflux protein CusF
MNRKHGLIIPTTVLAVLLTACGQQRESETATDAQPKPADTAMASAAPADSMSKDMPMPQNETHPENEHSAMGTITAVDAAAGTVTIAHEAVASAGWPAMTMTFKLADPKRAADLHTGDHVKFTFSLSEKGEATVVTIALAGKGM